MTSHHLKAQSRDQSLGRKELNHLRKSGQIPAVVYGKGMESSPVFVNLLDYKKMVKEHGKVFELEFNGKKEIVNAKTVQTDPIGKVVQHIDFQRLDRNQKTTVEVPIKFVGDAPGAKAGGIIQPHLENLKISGKPSDIPDHIDIDISAVELHHSLHISDIKVAAGLEIINEPDVTLISCHLPKVEKEEPAEVEAAADGAEATAEASAGPAEAPAAEEKKAA